MNQDSGLSGVSDFWQQIENAPRIFLALDYDGTLAPFQLNRFEAVPLAGVVEILKEIRHSEIVTLAIVSGRSVEEILQLLGDLDILIIGTHGSQIYTLNKELEVSRLTKQQNELLDRAARLIEEWGFGHKIERKTTTVAIHTRGLESARARDLEKKFCELLAEDASKTGLECRFFNGGAELRLASVNKGSALRKIMERHGASTLVVYLGDDETDEDAFRVVQERGGIGIKVAPKDIETIARGRLSSCDAALNFLREFNRVIRQKGG